MHKQVDIVILDDDQMLVDSLVIFFESKGKVVDKYYKPTKFLENVAQYNKNTKICMDNDFKSSINGIELAKRLHKMGYTKLYLLSGRDFEKEQVPSYLTVILKTDTDKLSKLAE